MEPLDTISWTSERNGYSNKEFFVDGVIDQIDGNVVVDLTEIDPSDYSWDSAVDYVPVIASPTIHPSPDVQVVIGFDAQGVVLRTDANKQPIAAIQVSWSPNVSDDISGIQIEITRVTGTSIVFDQLFKDIDAGRAFASQNIRPLTDYHVRARYEAISPRETAWTAPISVRTPDVSFGLSDLSDEVNTAITTAQDAADQAAADAAQVQMNLDNAVMSFSGDPAVVSMAVANAQQAEMDAEAAARRAVAAQGASEAARDLAQEYEMDAEIFSITSERIPIILGLSTLVEPRAAWTGDSQFSRSAIAGMPPSIIKPPIAESSGEFVTNDAEFGSAFHFTNTGNLTIGQAVGFEYEHGNIYEVTYRFRILNNGTMNSNRVSIRFGITTQQGIVIRQSNLQPAAQSFNMADGIIEHRVQFSSELDLESMPDQSIMIPMNSSSADRAYVHFRQNQSGLSNGLCAVEQIIIRDVTESLKSASSASASARSAASADADADAVGQTAMAITQQITDAQTVLANAQTLQGQASMAASDAEGARAGAAIIQMAVAGLQDEVEDTIAATGPENFESPLEAWIDDESDTNTDPSTKPTIPESSIISK